MDKLVAGIHLSGLHSSKTSIVVLRASGSGEKCEFVDSFDSLGPIGGKTSDDRIMEVFSHVDPVESIFTDAPTFAPPCIECELSTCPGLAECVDIDAAYLTKVWSEESPQRTKSQRKRVVNPQQHRVADLPVLLGKEGPQLNQDYSLGYSPNRAHLLSRVEVLQKKLNHIDRGLVLLETNVSRTLSRIAIHHGLAPSIGGDYRNFEKGTDARNTFLLALLDTGYLDLTELQRFKLQSELPLFEAFVCAYVGVLYSRGRAELPPTHQQSKRKWVYLPRF